MFIFQFKLYTCVFYISIAVVFAYYEEWSQMVNDLQEQAKEMMRQYEERCKEKKV